MNNGNPYRATLLTLCLAALVIALLCFLLAFILGNAAMSAGSFAQAGAVVVFSGIGGVLLPISGVCLLLWLVVSSIGWRPSDRPVPVPRPPAAGSPPRPADWLDQDGV